MKQYLVLVRHTLDDLPVFLSDDKDKALAFAYKCGANSGDKAAAVLGLDATTPLNVTLVTFENGVPVDATFIKDLEDES